MSESKATVNLANPHDLKFVSQDGHLPDAIILRKIKQGEVFLLCVDAQPVGYLRLEFLWSSMPYIALIYIQQVQRKHGYSRQLLAFVEKHLQGQGHTSLYSASQLDEPAPQAWHRHMGFVECGVINGINVGGIGEVFFRKLL